MQVTTIIHITAVQTENDVCKYVLYVQIYLFIQHIYMLGSEARIRPNRDLVDPIGLRLIDILRENLFMFDLGCLANVRRLVEAIGKNKTILRYVEITR